MAGHWRPTRIRADGQVVKNKKKNPRERKPKPLTPLKPRAEYETTSVSLTRTIVGLDRLQGGHSLMGLARATGLSPSYLSRIWAGKRIPSLEVTVRLAEAMGSTVGDLADVLLGRAPVTREAA